MSESVSPSASGARARRSTARLHAVQALYQRAARGTPLPQLLNEFHAHRLGIEVEELDFGEADRDFFDDLVRGTTARLAEIDSTLEPCLAAGWTLERLDPLMHQLLRAGTYELMARPDVPRRAVVSEYADLAHAFYAASEAGFANALLDRLARRLRAAER
jgi:N utilization substance protein B